MISAIRHHNHLNGVVFSTLEFLFLFAVAAFFASAYVIRQNWLFAMVAAGIALNALFIVGFGVASWRRGEMGARLSRLFDREYRTQVHKDYPNLTRETLFISVGTLIPYALTFAVLADLLRARVALAGKRMP